MFFFYQNILKLTLDQEVQHEAHEQNKTCCPQPARKDNMDGSQLAYFRPNFDPQARN